MSGSQVLGMSKAADAFRTISEVAEELDIPQHVLRFWETRFNSIRPLKRGGGRRYYRPDDVDLLRGIRQLLYGQGYTIKGVQRILKEEGARVVQDVGRGGALPSPGRQDPAEYEPEDVGVEPYGQEPSWATSPDTPAFLRSTPNAPEREAYPHAGGAHHPAPAVQARAAGDALASGDHDMLRAALTELHECQRVLDGLKRR